MNKYLITFEIRDGENEYRDYGIFNEEDTEENIIKYFGIGFDVSKYCPTWGCDCISGNQNLTEININGTFKKAIIPNTELYFDVCS